jgi:hypothetical protein
MPKMETFNGDLKSNWDTFIYQFERQGKKYRWKDKKKVKCLLDLLRDKALEYARQSKGKSYSKIKKKMKKRFSKKDEPSTAWRKLQYVQQKDESLEEFAQDMQDLVDIAYTKANSRTKKELGTEAFLKGCKDKDAASKAMEKNPKSIPQALVHVKQAISNRRALYGSKSPYSAAKQVTFEQGESSEEGYGVRTVRSNGASRGILKGDSGTSPPPSRTSNSEVTQLLAAVNELVKKVGFQGSKGSLSPSPQRLQYMQCYECRELGHMAKDCPKRSPRKKVQIQCYECKELGHVRRECPNSPNSPRRTSSSQTQSPTRGTVPGPPLNS